MKQVSFGIVLLLGLFFTSCEDASKTEEIKTMDKDTIVVKEDSAHAKMDTTLPR